MNFIHRWTFSKEEIHEPFIYLKDAIDCGNRWVFAAHILHVAGMLKLLFTKSTEAELSLNLKKQANF